MHEETMFLLKVGAAHQMPSAFLASIEPQRAQSRRTKSFTSQHSLIILLQRKPCIKE